MRIAAKHKSEKKKTISKVKKCLSSFLLVELESYTTENFGESVLNYSESKIPD